MKFSFSLKGKHVEKEVEKESHIYIYTHTRVCFCSVYKGIPCTHCKNKITLYDTHRMVLMIYC